MFITFVQHVSFFGSNRAFWQSSAGERSPEGGNAHEVDEEVQAMCYHCKLAENYCPRPCQVHVARAEASTYRRGLQIVNIDSKRVEFGGILPVHLLICMNRTYGEDGVKEVCQRHWHVQRQVHHRH